MNTTKSPSSRGPRTRASKTPSPPARASAARSATRPRAAASAREQHARPIRTRLFAYGTLLRGEKNHRFIARSTFVGEAQTQPLFTLYDLGPYPGLVAGGQHAVAGEVYEVNEATLAELDRLEGHPKFYQRTPIRLADDSLVLAYLLQLAQVEGSSPIASGSWRTRHAERATSSR